MLPDGRHTKGSLMTSPTGQAESVPTCNTADLVMIHRVIRYGFREADGLIRGVAAGDIARARIVGTQVASTVSGLHHHHEGEDLILWDTLEQRSPGCAIHVSLMKSQHAEVATLIKQVEDALPAWEQGAGADERDKVAELVNAIEASLAVHLGNEEQLILPVARTTMSQREWDRLGEHVQASMSKSELLIQVGWIVEALGPEDGPRFVREVLPAPVRLIWGTVGKRQFAKHRRLVYGH